MDTSKIAHQVGQAQGQAQEKGSQLMEKTDGAASKGNYDAGKAQGQAEEKAGQLIEKAGNAAQSTKETVQQTGQQVKATTLGAADAVTNATGMNK